MKSNINTDNGELSLLMCGASLFSHLLLDQQKDEYLCSFLEAVPRLVIRHLLQPVVQLLLRLAVVLCCCCSLSEQSSTLLASAPDSKSVSATRISLMAFLSSLIFFLGIANNYNSLPYLVSSGRLAQFQKPYASELGTSSAVTAKQI